MLISAVLALYSKTWTNQEENITLTTGFYKIQMVGAQGSGLYPGVGGKAAQYRGVVTIEDSATVHVIAGSYPGEGQYGGVESGATSNGGYGGGYSAVYINDVLYAMVGGGGGGASENYNGLPAEGEIDMKGKPSSHNAQSEQCSSQGRSRCGGGGAGYFPGNGGTPSHPQGQGGSSFMYYIGVHDRVLSSGSDLISDGFDLNIGTSGQVKIEQIKRCQGDCIMCDYDLTNKCTKCPANKHLYKQTTRDWICLDNCSQSTGPTFLNQDGECQACNPGCNKCNNTKMCLECSPPYFLYNNRCHSSRPKEEEKTNTTTEASFTITDATHSSNSESQAAILHTNISDKGEEDRRKLWIIIAACVGGVALVVIIIVVIIFKKRSKEDSPEMVEENVGGVRDTTTTTVTVENPMYLDSLELGDDPFRPDFEENQEESGVFHPKNVDPENK